MPSVWAPGASSPLNKFTTPSFRFNGMTGDPPYRNERTPDPSDPDKWLDHVSSIPFGTAFGFDFPSIHHGFGKFSNGAETRKFFRPITDSFPNQPDDPDYKPGFKMLVAARGFGLMNWTCLQQLHQEEMHDRWLLFTRSSEAQMGQIPVYRLIGVEEVFIEARKGSFFKLVFEFIAWMPRNPALFGPPLIDLNKAVTTATVEIPDHTPSRPAVIDQVHQERMAQSRLTTAKSRDPRYNATHAATEDASVSTKVSTASQSPKLGFSTLLDDEIPW